MSHHRFLSSLYRDGGNVHNLVSNIIDVGIFLADKKMMFKVEVCEHVNIGVFEELKMAICEKVNMSICEY